MIVLAEKTETEKSARKKQERDKKNENPANERNLDTHSGHGSVRAIQIEIQFELSKIRTE
jgi:hypothetical protein